MLNWLRSFFEGSEGDANTTRTATVHNLQVGDIVVYLDDTYIVQQKIVNHDNGFFWYDYLLGGGEAKNLWLSVEDDDELILALFEPAKLPSPLSPESKAPQEMTFEGLHYRLDETGKADAKITRESGTETRTTVTRWDYTGPDGLLLSFQRWGDEPFEVMLGRRISEGSLDIMTNPSIS